MRDRLIEFINYARLYGDGTSESIADYLLANGVIVPTVELGQTLYVLEDIGIQTLPEITQLEVFRIHFTVAEDGLDYHIVCITKGRSIWHIKYEDIGKTVFFTREEAEKAVADAKMKEGDNNDANG